jgi:hypothetical protein
MLPCGEAKASFFRKGTSCTMLKLQIMQLVCQMPIIEKCASMSHML